MANDKTLTITVIVVFLAAIVIIMYFLFFKKDENIIFPPDIGPEDPPDDPPDPGPGDDDVDPYFPPGFQFINLDRTRSNTRSMTFNFNAQYYTTLLSGTFRVGGSVYTNVRIEYKKDGTWRHIGTVGGWPDGFTQFSFTINDQCSGIKFIAEQGILPWIGDRYIDEVHGQLLCEVG